MKGLDVAGLRECQRGLNATVRVSKDGKGGHLHPWRLSICIGKVYESCQTKNAM